MSYTRFVHLRLPNGAKTNSTRFRWWQPAHSGREHDQWALDEVLVGSFGNYENFEDDFEVRRI